MRNEAGEICLRLRINVGAQFYYAKLEVSVLDGKLFWIHAEAKQETPHFFKGTSVQVDLH